MFAWRTLAALLCLAVAPPLSNVIGIDDGPFARDGRAPVLIAGPVFSGSRLDGLLTTHVEKDGLDATDQLADMVAGSKFLEHLQLIMIGGVTLGGFNVVDLPRLCQRTGLPVLALCRKRPDLVAIRSALGHLPEAESRWALIEKLGSAEPLGRLFVHRIGLDLDAAAEAIARSTIHGNFPEPLRVAHLLAGGFTTGQSTGAA